MATSAIDTTITLGPGVHTIRFESVSGSFTLSPLSVTLPPAVDLAASAGGRAAGSATLTRRTGLVGAAAGHAGASGRVNFPLAASAAGHASGAGTLQVQPSLQGTAAGQASAAGTISQLQPGPVRVLTLTAGDGSVLKFAVPIVQLTAGDGSGTGIGIYPSGYFGPTWALQGSAGGHAGAVATPGQLQHLAGSADGHAAGSASTGDVGATGAGAGQAGASGALDVDQPLSGQADAHAGATAVGPQLPISLEGTAAGQAGGAGVQGQVPLSGRAEGTGGATGELDQAQPLSGVAAGTATALVVPQSTNTAPRLRLSLMGPALSLGLMPTPALRCAIYGPRLTLQMRAEE